MEDLRGLRLVVESGGDEGIVGVAMTVVLLQDLRGFRLGRLATLTPGLFLAASSAHDLVALALSALDGPVLGGGVIRVVLVRHLPPPTLASSALQCFLSIAINRRWYSEA